MCDRKTRKIKRGTWTEADALTEKKNLVPVVALAKKNKTSTPKKVSEVPLTAYERLISKRARLHLSRLKPGYYDQDDISYSERILGYSRSDLSRTVGDKFSRENYHLDHIVPIKVLIQQGVTSPRIINHLDNLQFITARQNLKKGARLKKSDTWLLIKLTKLQDIENHSIKIQDDAYTKRPYWERACIELENSDGIKILYNGEPKKLQSTPSFPRTSSPKTYSDWKTTCVDAASNLIDYETEECLIFIRHFIRFDPSTEGWLDKKFGSFIGLDLRSLNAALVDVRCSFKQAASVLKYYDCNIKTLNELEPTKENIAKFESINSIENLSKYVGSFNNLLLLNLKSTRKGKGLIWRLFN
ncbi:HNH endonuclease signature motif containing protein [Vibrio breoganii]